MRKILQEHSSVWNVRIPELTKPQIVVLAFLILNPGVDQVTMSRLSVIDTATLAGVILRLEKRGLVTRETDPEDRRRYLLQITDEGKAAYRAATKVAEKVDDEMMARLTPDEQEQLIVLLNKLATPPAE
jgi:MarR family transcriptional regulator, temperature-dependent positive regulator of motility